MAIYHFTITNGSKSKGKVAATRAAYLTRSGTYADRDDLVFAESSNLPSWSSDAADFWSSADELERKNARVYREAEFALPRELSPDAQVKLARDFARDLTAMHGLAYTLAIHDEDGHNPHAHLMWCDRENDGYERERGQWFKRANKEEPSKGGAAKVRDMLGKHWYKEVRQDWELAANAALELAGERARVDCRSYAEQDRDKPELEQRIPQIHLGVTTKVLERKGVKTPRLERWEAIERARAERREAPTVEPERKLTPAYVDPVDEALKRDAAKYLEQLEREEVAQFEREEALLQRIRELNPDLDVCRFQTMETVSGRYLDWDAIEGFGFVKTSDDELVAFAAPQNHESMRGREVEVKFDASYAIEVRPKRLNLEEYRAANPTFQLDILQRSSKHLHGKAVGQTIEMEEGRFCVFRDTRHQGAKPRLVLVAEHEKINGLKQGEEAEVFYGASGELRVYERSRGRSR